MHPSLAWISDELRDLESQGLRRQRRQIETLPGGWCQIGDRRLRNFAGNDYLGLAHDERLKAAAVQAIAESGCGAGASALVSGRSHWLAALEERVAAFEDTESALVFPTGYAANLGVLTALAGSSDVIFCDRLNHASLVDGCRLSGARLQVYRHDDLPGLTQRLKRSQARRRLIVTDSVFSMEGDHAPLGELAEIAGQTDSALIVDEAHGTGVWGARGRGVCELQGVESSVAVRIGTLSKAAGALGGFVAGDRTLMDWFLNRSRTQIYSTALPPAVCAAAAAGLEVIAAEPERRERLMGLCTRLRQSLRAMEIPPLAASQGPIVPLVLETPECVVQAAADLQEQGFLVGAIRPPSVPRGTSRLRITLTAAHDDAAVEGLLRAIDRTWQFREFRRSRPSNC